MGLRDGGQFIARKRRTGRFERIPSIRLKDAGQDDAGAHDGAMREILYPLHHRCSLGRNLSAYLSFSESLAESSNGND